MVFKWQLAVSVAVCLWAPHCAQQEPYKLPVGVLLKDNEIYDYVVVGGGAAGCAVAGRLALAGHAVLLVEAGGDPDPLAYIPAAAMGLLGSDIDWKYQTISNNKSCLSSLDRSCRFSRGKCLGGSTAINYMMFTRGNRQDYDNFDIPGWTWDDLKPYFLRYEGFQDIDRLPRSSLPYHNDSGILKIDYFADPQNPWHSRIVRGFNYLGFPRNLDVNGVTQIGVSEVAGYVYRGERMTTARAYLTLDPVKESLRVAKFAHCTGVIIDEENVARGVTVVQNKINVTIHVYARKEVILSAGAIGTPQILLLSGVGPAAHLREMGIPVRVDLPVGDNMSDHVLPLMVLLVDCGIDLLGTVSEVTGAVLSLAQYLVDRSGPLASNNLVDITAFGNTSCYDCCNKRLRKGGVCQLPSLQMIHAYVGLGLLPLVKPLFQNAVHLNDDLVEQVAKANEKCGLIIKSPIVLQPYSRGWVRLQSADPTAPPAIYPNYLGDERDVEEMLRAITIVEDLLTTPPFRKNNARLFHAQFPECPPYTAGREAYWRCYVRHMTYSVFHAVGTCALDSVLDRRLRVRGVRRLRVADASAVPYLPRGNTEAVCVAFGERVVDFILQDDDTQ